jgi:hypothetical protein
MLRRKKPAPPAGRRPARRADVPDLSRVAYADTRPTTSAADLLRESERRFELTSAGRAQVDREMGPRPRPLELVAHGVRYRAAVAFGDPMKRVYLTPVEPGAGWAGGERPVPVTCYRDTPAWWAEEKYDLEECLGEDFRENACTCGHYRYDLGCEHVAQCERLGLLPITEVWSALEPAPGSALEGELSRAWEPAGEAGCGEQGGRSDG